MNNSPKLWVWAGSSDDKLDVLRYVSATDADVLSQPIVEAENAALRKKNKWLEATIEKAISLMCEDKCSLNCCSYKARTILDAKKEGK